ncbi:acetyl-CoA synthetase-like protein [Infundibulicybe gibba]|nr:acetyl-CoA synthetase-like protein [Infundibulicybe gibba]
MLAQNSFTATSTTVQLQCPEDTTNLERIMLAAEGNLQKLMSAFFGRPIFVDTVYAHTSPRDYPASLEHPITQSRQVDITCSSRTVCIATSVVTITSVECEQLFLEEKVAIGQLFRRLGTPPKFSLLSARTRRTYTLEADGVLCEILEVFPDRDMFVLGEAWFDTPNSTATASEESSEPSSSVSKFSLILHPTPGELPNTEYELARLVVQEASKWSDRLSLILAAKGASQDAEAPVVALLAESGFHYAITILALLKLNTTVLVLAPSNSEAAVEHLLDACQVSVLISGQTYIALARRAAERSFTAVTSLDHSAANAFSEGRALKLLYPTPPIVPIIVHSSGSTSFPKPVRWSHASLLSNSQLMLTEGGWSAFTDPNNRFLCLGPLFHTMGLTVGLAGAICAGTTIVFPLTQVWPPSPADIVRSFGSTEIRTCIIVPLLLEQLVDTLEAEGYANPLKPLVKLNLLLTGGAHCPDKLANRLVASGVNLKCIYGSSETGHVMIGAHERPAPGDTTRWNLLRPFPHTSVIFKPFGDGNTPGEQLYQVHVSRDDVRLAVGVLDEESETWNTGDVVQEVPAGSGWYKILYRDDDILVHVSGEKTNPVPMETSIRSHKLIERVAIVGHRRPVTAAIVQLEANEALSYTEEERLNIVRDAIKTANKAAPSHSQIVEEMIYLLPLDSEKQLPRTPKGNCIRPKVLAEFSQEIDNMYREFEGDTDSFYGSTGSSAVTLADVEEQVTKICEDVVGKPITPPDASLFDFGLDSVTAMQLRNRLAKAFSTKLPQQFVYQNFTLALLTAALHTQVSSRRMTPLRSTSPVEEVGKGDILSMLRDRQLATLRDSSTLVLASRALYQAPLGMASHVVAVVGAAGSLGIWQLKALLDRLDVRRVVCFVRGTVGSIYDKIATGFKKAGLEKLAAQAEDWRLGQLQYPDVPAVNLEQRLVVLPFDLAKPHFGAADYVALASTLTTIIHTGWKMDFNQVVQGFEDCLNGTTQLLLLAGFMRPKRFYFISSIGVVLESETTPVPEKIMPWTKDDPSPASPHGYSESKFICEYLVEAASALLEIPCSVARIGQISGDTLAGVWKTQEMNPIIIAGSARVGKFPVVPGVVLDWTPVDTVGHATVELALGVQHNKSTAVHHIVNPTPLTYEDLARDLRTAGVPVSPVPPAKWWTAIQADEGNPCHAIEAYIEEAVVNAHVDLAKTGGRGVTLDIQETVKLAPNSLARCPPLDAALWTKYVAHWREIGFLKV